MSTVHETAKLGFGSGTNELYDRARPTYPPPALNFIRSKLEGKGPFDIIEVASGTGLFTRTLLAHPEWQDSIGSLRAVEPSEGMRTTFASKTDDSRISLKDGTFISTGEESESADAVMIAQAFHWAHPAYDETMKEIARILKPNGTAFFIWNLED
ncbi:11030_t:CDS:2, partial [Acaulospora colombiana]